MITIIGFLGNYKKLFLFKKFDFLGRAWEFFQESIRNFSSSEEHFLFGGGEGGGGKHNKFFFKSNIGAMKEGALVFWEGIKNFLFELKFFWGVGICLVECARSVLFRLLFKFKNHRGNINY